MGGGYPWSQNQYTLSAPFVMRRTCRDPVRTKGNCLSGNIIQSSRHQGEHVRATRIPTELSLARGASLPR